MFDIQHQFRHSTFRVLWVPWEIFLIKKKDRKSTTTTFKTSFFLQQNFSRKKVLLVQRLHPVSKVTDKKIWMVPNTNELILISKVKSSWKKLKWIVIELITSQNRYYFTGKIKRLNYSSSVPISQSEVVL